MSIRENATIPETEQLERERQGSIAPEITSNFSKIPSNHLMREVTQISGRRGITKFTGGQIIKHGLVTITVYGNQIVSAVDWQNLDFIEIMWKEKGNNDTVRFTLEEFMKRRGFKNVKSARRAIKEGLNRLYNMSVSCNRYAKDENGALKQMLEAEFRLINEKAWEETRGVFSVALTPNFSRYLKGRLLNVMNYPEFLLTINTSRNPTAYHIGRYLAEQKNITHLKSQENEDFISIKAILKACDSLPTPEEIKKTGRYIERIITPFISALNMLAPHITWEFSKTQREPLTEEEKKKALTDIGFFMSLFIKTKWKDYPDMTETKEKRQKAIEENKKRKEKSKLIAMADIERKKIRTREQAKKQSETV